MHDARFSVTTRLLGLISAVALSPLIACAAPSAQSEPSSTSAPTETTAAEMLPVDAKGIDTARPTLDTLVDKAPTAVPASPAPVMPYRGVNLSGADFGSVLPGREGPDYSFPTPAQVDYYLSKGMTTFRVGFRWERMQRAAYATFEPTYTSKIDALVSYATSKGAKVILNPQNFARYYGETVGSAKVPIAVFASFWGQLSAKWASNPNVMFNLVNEPHDIATEQWVDAANAAIAAIRATGAKNTIVVPGNGWTGAHAWDSSAYGTPNSKALLDIVDPGDNVIFEAHQYLDADSSGAGEQCVSPTIGTARLAPFLKWLRDNHRRGMLGELAGARNPTCYAAVHDMLTTIMASSDVLVGWLWWGGGPGWGEYKFTLEPLNGTERPQMGVIAPFLTK
jgi:endoglucanase